MIGHQCPEGHPCRTDQGRLRPYSCADCSGLLTAGGLCARCGTLWTLNNFQRDHQRAVIEEEREAAT